MGRKIRRGRSSGEKRKCVSLADNTREIHRQIVSHEAGAATLDFPALITKVKTEGRCHAEQ